MTQQGQKKWVFAELVDDVNNLEQLIAYSFYKADKVDLANNSRGRQKSEPTIQRELTNFHDQVAHSDRRLTDYRDKANAILNSYIQSVSDGVAFTYEKKLEKMISDHKSEIERLNADHVQSIDNAMKKWFSDAHVYAENEKEKNKTWKSRGKKISKWFFSGIPGLTATIMTTVIIIGVYGLFNNDLNNSVRAGFDKVLDRVMPRHGVSALNTDSNDAVKATAPSN